MLSLALAWAEVLKADRDPHRRERGGLFRISGLPAGIRRGVRAARGARHQGGRGGRKRCACRRRSFNMSKAQIVREGVRLGVDYSLTVSCYQADDDGRACGLL